MELAREGRHLAEFYEPAGQNYLSIPGLQPGCRAAEEGGPVPAAEPGEPSAGAAGTLGVPGKAAEGGSAVEEQPPSKAGAGTQAEADDLAQYPGALGCYFMGTWGSTYRHAGGRVASCCDSGPCSPRPARLGKAAVRRELERLQLRLLRTQAKLLVYAIASQPSPLHQLHVACCRRIAQVDSRP